MLHVLPLSVAADGVFTLSDRTEARARYPDPVLQATRNENAVALDVDTLVDARLVWKTHIATYTVADLPRFTLLDFNGAAISPAFLDSVVLTGEWRWPRVGLRVNENASYGQLSVESLSAIPAVGTPAPAPSPTGAPPSPTGATIVPTTSQPILFVSSDSSVSSALSLR
ncbi:MAG TPA: hypothetical protein VHS09_13790, partial [Polyangiaceae bacterium]|nr:hypothetical protein [Polyangiaceae bacterium]